MGGSLAQEAQNFPMLRRLQPARKPVGADRTRSPLVDQPERLRRGEEPLELGRALAELLELAAPLPREGARHRLAALVASGGGERRRDP